MKTKKYPKDGEIVAIEYQDDWVDFEKPKFIIAQRIDGGWFSLMDLKRLRESQSCRVVRWWSLDNKKANELLVHSLNIVQKTLRFIKDIF